MTIYTIDTATKKRIAQKVVEQEQPGYSCDYRGRWYAVDTDGDQVFDSVMHAEHHRPWNPWHDNAIAIPVTACIDWSQNPDFSIEIDEDEDAYDDTVAFAELYVLPLIDVPVDVEEEEV